MEAVIKKIVSIRANELRIGNILQDAIRLEKALIVYKIEPEVIVCGSEDFNYPYLVEMLDPIPLTPEILEKAGFQTIDMNDLGLYISLKISRDIGLNWNNKSIWIGEYNTKVVYLHQLQNIYFALAGKELEIDLSK